MILKESIQKEVNTYSLHDSIINDFRFENKKLVMNFQEGFYSTDSKGKHIKQESNCSISFEFEIPEDEELNVTIFRRFNSKNKELKFDDFTRLVQNKHMRIDLEFRSGFAQSIVLHGYVNGKGIYEITLVFVAEIAYTCD